MKKIKLFLVATIATLAITATSCSNGNDNNPKLDNNLPIVNTSEVNSISGTTSVSGGVIIFDGGSNVIARGICWSISPNPTIGDNHTIDAAGTGTFISRAINLTLGTTYYLRAYATNTIGTAYGLQMVFKTTSTPIIITKEVASITSTTAISGGKVVSNDGSIITSRGVCWSSSPNPTFTDSHTTSTLNNSDFISNITSLNPNTKYFIRAYAENTNGIAYGENISFTTKQKTQAHKVEFTTGVLNSWVSVTLTTIIDSEDGTQTTVNSNFNYTNNIISVNIPENTRHFKLVFYIEDSSTAHVKFYNIENNSIIHEETISKQEYNYEYTF